MGLVIGFWGGLYIGASDGWDKKTPSVQDLSMFDAFGNKLSSRSTANCYVVRRAGTYKIPLVYGNGIKNGIVNPSAYTRQGDKYTADFVNHLGNMLTSPYIEENSGCVAASAGLLWQTATMISQVSLADGFLVFSIDNIPNSNGLAILWVKDSVGDIMWSWTIWATNDDLTPVTLTNHTGFNYDVIPEGLGAIWNADRSHYVAPHYQWGRKDPFIPSSDYNSTTPMSVFDINGDAYVGETVYGVADDSDKSGTVRSVANSIKMPNRLFLEYNASKKIWNNLAWCNNFWNAAITTQDENDDSQASAIKTIYDPCPVGLMLPASTFATGFTASGGNVSTAPTGCEVIGAFANGWVFKKNSTDSTGLYIPALGNRHRSTDSLRNVGTVGLWWSYSPMGASFMRYLHFTNSGINTLGTGNPASGCTILPSREL